MEIFCCDTILEFCKMLPLRENGMEGAEDLSVLFRGIACEVQLRQNKSLIQISNNRSINLYNIKALLNFNVTCAILRKQMLTNYFIIRNFKRTT